MAVAGVDMFDFQNVMKDYYGYKPKESDDAGRASKRAFQANMVQSAFDSQLAMMQAEQAQQYDLDTRMATADLELSNQKALMSDTFDYGMQKMAAEFDYQSRFAGQMHGYDLEKMDRAGEIQQEQTKLEGVENRLNLGEQGRQDRLSLGTAGEQERLTLGTKGAEDRKSIETQGNVDISKIGAQGDVDVTKIGATGGEERKTVQTSGEEQRKGIQTTGTEQRKTIAAQSVADIGSIQAQGGVDLQKIGAAGDQERMTIGAKGDDTRKTMSAATRETAKDRANQFSFANQLAAR